MRYPTAIRTLVAALFLTLFAVGSFPKGVLHDALAAHTDAAKCLNELPNRDCFHQRDFNCGFTDWVVTSPYTGAAAMPAAVPVAPFSSFFQRPYARTVQKCLVDAEGRGPPASV